MEGSPSYLSMALSASLPSFPPWLLFLHLPTSSLTTMPSPFFFPSLSLSLPPFLLLRSLMLPKTRQMSGSTVCAYPRAASRLSMPATSPTHRCVAPASTSTVRAPSLTSATVPLPTLTMWGCSSTTTLRYARAYVHTYVYVCFWVVHAYMCTCVSMSMYMVNYRLIARPLVCIQVDVCN